MTTEKKPTIIVAKLEGRCSRCDDPIKPGDRIEKTSTGWMHEDCPADPPYSAGPLGVRSRMSRPTTLTGPWLALSKKFESIEALATALGVSARTIRHWHDGERTPHNSSRLHVEGVAKKHGVTLTWKKKQAPS